MLKLGLLVEKSFEPNVGNVIYNNLQKFGTMICASNDDLQHDYDFKIPKFDLFDPRENTTVSHITYFNECQSLFVLCSSVEVIKNFALGINDSFLLASLSAFRGNIYFCIKEQIGFELQNLQSTLNQFSPRFKIVSVLNSIDIGNLNEIVKQDILKQKLLGHKILVVSCEEVSKVDDVRIVSNNINQSLQTKVLDELINLGSQIHWINNWCNSKRGVVIKNYKNYEMAKQYVNKNFDNYQAIIWLEPKNTYTTNLQKRGKLSSENEFKLVLSKTTPSNNLKNTLYVTCEQQIFKIKQNNLENPKLKKTLVEIINKIKIK